MKAIIYVLCGKLSNNVRDVNQEVGLFDDTIFCDYYFIIFDKEQKYYFWTSLKHLKSVRPNGKNLPFQVNWGENREPCSQKEQETLKMIIRATIDSIKQSIDSNMLINNELEKKLLSL